MIAWLYSLIIAIRSIQDNDFLPTINQLKDDLKYNSDTAVVEYLLRKRLFANQPKVFIVNINETGRDVFIGRDDDVKYELIIGREATDNMNVIVNRDGSQLAVYVDFYVIISNSVDPIDDDTKFKIIAYINKYKLGKKFIMKYQNETIIYQSL